MTTLKDHVELLPEKAATKSRDWGRGYAQAVKDVIVLLDNHDRELLTDTCLCGEP